MQTDLAAKPLFIVVLALLTGLTAVAVAISLPAIPEMVVELGTTMSLGQQVIALFMLGMAVGQLPAGLLSDRLGRMPVIYFGVGLFALCGVIAAISNDISVVLVARFAQGLGAAVGMVLSRAIVRDVSSGATAARLMSLMVMIFTLGPMIAPMLGAFLADNWGWRAPLHALGIIGLLTLFLVRSGLQETHTPSADQHIGRQFVTSLREFFSHREALFSLCIIMFTAAGFMVLITGSAAVIIEIYGYPVVWFGAIFALTGVALFIGSMIGRQLLLRLATVHVIGVGAAVVALVAAQMLLIEWLGDAHFWWVWGNCCLYMLGVGLLLPNANALALEPVPAIAGMASSIVGTVQGLAAATSAIVSSLLYDGTISSITYVMGGAGFAVLLTYLLHKSLFGLVIPAGGGN